MKKIKLLALVLAVVLCATAFVGCAGKKSGNDDEGGKGGNSRYTAENEEFVIGVSGPLTGGAAVYGVAVQNSALLAVEEINAAGGFNGKEFKLVPLDDMHDATKIATNYSSLLEGGMQVSLGTVTTAPGLEWKNLSAEDNVFFLTPSASGDDIVGLGNGFQMCFADGNQGEVAAEFVNDNCKNEKVGVFYKSDDPYSNGIYEQFKSTLDSSIKTTVTSFTDANATDFSTQIDTLKDCTFIFMPTYYDPASIFMTQAKNVLAADATYYGCDGFDGIDSKEGFDITTIPQKVTMLSHFNSKAEDGMAKEFIDKYVEKYGKDTLNQFGASAYDCVYAIYYAMQEAIEDGKEIPVTISASDLCDILKAEFADGFTLEKGVTGENITWDEKGYVKKSAIQYVIKEAN